MKNDHKKRSVIRILGVRKELLTVTDLQFEECIRQMTDGDKDGLRIIYEEYIGYIYAIVLDVLKNKENAEDVSADFFIKLWTVAASYKPGNGHRAWMVRIARNMSIDFLRKHRREELNDQMEDAGDKSDTDNYGQSIYAGDTGSRVEDEVISDLSLQEALAMLNEKEREVINLKVVADMTFKEIAELLNTPMGTITWRYQSAIKKLRRCGYE